MKIRIIALLLVVLFTSNIQAQKSEIGIGLGVSSYIGDLSSPELNTYFNQSHPAVQVFYNYYFNQKLNTRISLGATILSANDNKSSKQWQLERNLSFKTNLVEANGVIEYNIFGISNLINPYVYGGVNVFHFNPKTLYDDEWVELQPLGTEGQGSVIHPELQKYKLYDISMIFGAGLKVKLTNSITISAEVGWRRTNTDYLDDVSGNYINYYELRRTNGELAADLSDRTKEYFNSTQTIDRESGTKRGGERIKDYYAISYLNFVYTLNSGNPFKNRRRIYCPKF